MLEPPDNGPGVGLALGDDATRHPLAVDLRQLIHRQVGAVLDAGQGQSGDPAPHSAEHRDLPAVEADEVLRAQVGPAGATTDEQQHQQTGQDDDGPSAAPRVGRDTGWLGSGDRSLAALGNLRSAGGTVGDAGRGSLRGLGGRTGDHRCEHRATRLHRIGHHDRDVVRAATAQGERDQPVDGFLRVLDRQRLAQCLEATDRAGQAVAAEQVAVTVADLADRQVELDLWPPVERPRDHRALWVAGRLLRGDPALVDEGLHERVVVGDLAELPVAQQVAARVADVQQPHPAARRQDRREGRAHALELGIAGDHVVQVLVGPHRRLAQGREQVGAGGVLVERGQRGDRHGARDLAGGVSAHPVRDSEQPGTGVDGVLVAGPQQAGVRARGEAQRQRHLLTGAARGRFSRS